MSTTDNLERKDFEREMFAEAQRRFPKQLNMDADTRRDGLFDGFCFGAKWQRDRSLPLAMSEEEMEEESHKWANAQAPWEGPVERTYARTVFIDGLRAANTRSKSLTVEKGHTFTESEVKAIVNELKEEAEDDHVRAWIDGVVTRHGLDPA